MTEERSDEDEIDVDDLLSLETPDDNRRFYAKWASCYENKFVKPNGYVLHENVVAAFLDAGGSAGGVTLDVGCGTGLVGVELRDVGEPCVDGVDISSEMIEIARAKKTVFDEPAYRDLIVADATKPLELPDDSYNGIVSAGAFAHGHLPPQVIRELVRVAAPTAVCALGIDADHYAELGFDGFLGELATSGLISSPSAIDVSVYETVRSEHANTRGVVSMFQVLP